MNVNRYGLSRHIPEETKREIRQRSGFGCVVCGLAIYEYEHINPEYADAREHNPDCICLLCAGCHGKVTRKLLSKQRVSEAYLNPMPKRNGFANEWFDIGNDAPTVVFAGSVYRNVRYPITLDRFHLMEMKPPEVPGTPHRISATFFTSRGEPSLQIIDNEWRQFIDNWDVELNGPVITVRDRQNFQSLKLRAIAGEGLEIERLKMQIKGYLVEGDAEQLKITKPNGSTLTVINSHMENGFGGIAV